MDSLATKRTPKAVQEALQNLPREIGDTYDKAMERIEATNDDDDRKIAMNFLLWITFSARPLSVAEVEHASAISDRATDVEEDEILGAGDLTSLCAGLVMIDASEIVRFVHLSAQRYFTENRKRWFSDGDLIVAQKCITYLSFKASKTGASSGLNERGAFKHRSQTHPFLEYSCCYWGRHASAHNVPEDLLEWIQKFLGSKPHLDSAVQAMWYSDSPDLANWDVKSGVYPLHLAAYFGLIQVILKILKAEKEVDPRDSFGTTPLMYAAANGHSSTASLLLKEGSNPNLSCKRSSTSLHRAIAYNKVSVARILLDQPNIEVNSRDTTRGDQTPLMLAASLQRNEILPMLLQKPTLEVNLQSGQYKSTALWLASSAGDAQVVRQILSHPDTDVNKKDHWSTPLREAARLGFFSVVETLLDHGADPEIQEGPKNASGTPLNRAIDYGHVAVTRLLLQRGANPNVLDTYNRTIIHSAAVNGQDEILRVLFEKPNKYGINVNAQGTNGRTALHDATYFNYCTIITLLFENGARTDIHDGSGNSPLGLAKEMGNLEALELLTKYRKNESAVDESMGRLKHTKTSNNSADAGLPTAIRLGMKDVVQSYIERSKTDSGINLNVVDLDQHSALHLAIQENHIDILRILLDARVDINTVDRLDRTPLHWTILYRNYKAAKHLLDAGADLSLIDHFGATPLDMGLQSSRYDKISVLLLERGAWPVNATSAKLQMALSVAAKYGSKELVKKLVDGGADALKKTAAG